MLRFVHFTPDELLAGYRAKVDAASDLSTAQREQYLGELKAGLEGYTYLED